MYFGEMDPFMVELLAERYNRIQQLEKEHNELKNEIEKLKKEIESKSTILDIRKIFIKGLEEDLEQTQKEKEYIIDHFEKTLLKMEELEKRTKGEINEK